VVLVGGHDGRHVVGAEQGREAGDGGGGDSVGLHGGLCWSGSETHSTQTQRIRF